MANSKVSKGLSSKAKTSLVMGIVIALLVLSVGGYFVYVSGIMARLIPAVKIEQTIDGKTKTIDTISVPELNYYYNQVLSMYSAYGITISDDYLNTMNEEKGKTNKQLLLDQAAESAMNVYLVRNYALKDKTFVSGADRFADEELYMFSLRAKNNNAPSTDSLLASYYGSGMSSRAYRETIVNAEISNEYEQYIRQFKFVPTEDEIQAVFDENPERFNSADFCYYFFSDSQYPDGQAAKSAEAVASKAVDVKSFNEAVIAEIGDEYANTIGFTVDSNSTFETNATKSTITDSSGKFPPESVDFVFDPSNVGTTKIYDTEVGSFIIYLDRSDLSDYNVYSYRQIVLENDLLNDEKATDEEMAKEITKLTSKLEKIQSGITDEMSFANAVKKNTTVADEITTAGYKSGVTGEITAATTAEETSLYTWLTDPARQHGDMIIIPDNDNTRVTLYYFDEVDVAWMNQISSELIAQKVTEWSQNELNLDSTVPYVAYDVVEKLTYYAGI